MSGVFGNPWFLPSTSFYEFEIDQSLRFNDDDGAYLSKAYSTTQTNLSFLELF